MQETLVLVFAPAFGADMKLFSGRNCIITTLQGPTQRFVLASSGTSKQSKGFWSPHKGTSDRRERVTYGVTKNLC